MLQKLPPVWWSRLILSKSDYVTRHFAALGAESYIAWTGSACSFGRGIVNNSPQNRIEPEIWSVCDAEPLQNREKDQGEYLQDSSNLMRKSLVESLQEVSQVSEKKKLRLLTGDPSGEYPEWRETSGPGAQVSRHQEAPSWPLCFTGWDGEGMTRQGIHAWYQGEHSEYWKTRPVPFQPTGDTLLTQYQWEQALLQRSLSKGKNPPRYQYCGGWRLVWQASDDTFPIRPGETGCQTKNPPGDLSLPNS